MPHFIIEHSSNLSDRHDLRALGKIIADVTEKTGAFPLAGTRVRFHPCETYVIADDHPDNAFLSVIMRIGAGRDLETQQNAGQVVFDAICDFFADDLASGHFLVSVDMEINDPQLSFKKNGISPRLNR